MPRVPVSVRDAIEDNVIFVEASQSVADALKIMIDKAVWSLVVRREAVPVGVVTERDLLRRCYAKNMNANETRVESVMSSPIVTIEPDAPFGQAMLLMAEKDIRRVYVVEKGRIIGRVTQTGAFGQILGIMIGLSSLLTGV